MARETFQLRTPISAAGPLRARPPPPDISRYFCAPAAAIAVPQRAPEEAPETSVHPPGPLEGASAASPVPFEAEATPPVIRSRAAQLLGPMGSQEEGMLVSWVQDTPDAPHTPSSAHLPPDCLADFRQSLLAAASCSSADESVSAAARANSCGLVAGREAALLRCGSSAPAREELGSVLASLLPSRPLSGGDAGSASRSSTQTGLETPSGRARRAPASGPTAEETGGGAGPASRLGPVRVQAPPPSHLKSLMRSSKTGSGRARGVRFSLGGAEEESRDGVGEDRSEVGRPSPAYRGRGQKRKALLELMEQVQSLVAGWAGDGEEVAEEMAGTASETVSEAVSATAAEAVVAEMAETAAETAAAPVPDAGWGDLAEAEMDGELEELEILAMTQIEQKLAMAESAAAANAASEGAASTPGPEPVPSLKRALPPALDQGTTAPSPAPSDQAVPETGSTCDWGEDDEDACDLDDAVAALEIAALAGHKASDARGGPASNEALEASGEALGSGGEMELGSPDSLHECRCVIEAVFERGEEVVLQLSETGEAADASPIWAHVRFPWSDVPFARGWPLSLVGTRVDAWEGRRHALVDQDRGALVLFPDLLLSGTRVAGAGGCLRRAVLEERVAGAGGAAGAAAGLGTLVHGLVQRALAQAQREADGEEVVEEGSCAHGRGSAAWWRSRLAAAVPGALRAGADAALESGLGSEAVVAALEQRAPALAAWLSRWVRLGSDAAAPDPVPLAMGLDARRAPRLGRACVSRVRDIEESIWAPVWGLKGSLDATVELRLGEGEAEVAPLELKTGRAHDSHAAQVLLYLLLLQARGRPAPAGLLWYADEPLPRVVPRGRGELSALLSQRNRLAAALGGGGELPPLAEDASVCRRCFARETCAIARWASVGEEKGEVEDEENARAETRLRAEEKPLTGASPRAETRPRAEEKPLAGAFPLPEASPADAAPSCSFDAAQETQARGFLRAWWRALALEEERAGELQAEAWRLSGPRRRLRHPERCAAGLRLAGYAPGALVAEFEARPGGQDRGWGVPEWGPGELVLVGREGGLVNLARGRVEEAQPGLGRVRVRLSRPLGADWARGPPDWEWRLDKDTLQSAFARQRGALLDLFRGRRDENGREVEGGERDGQPLEIWPPRCLDRARLVRLFALEALPRPPLPPEVPEPRWLATLCATLNPEQRGAVEAALGARDWVCVQGLPGSGKTATLAAAVEALVRAGKRVLVCACTNSAVDGLLRRARDGVGAWAREAGGRGAGRDRLGRIDSGSRPVLRLGHADRVHPGAVDLLPPPDASPEEMLGMARAARVVGATCAAADAPAVAAGAPYDACVVDEAGQLALPAALPALGMARAWLLAGDSRQLGPLVACERGGARERRLLGTSLLDRLCSGAGREANVRCLTRQYRMCRDVASLAGALFYEGRLACADAAVAGRCLRLPGWEAGGRELGGRPSSLAQEVWDPRRGVCFAPLPPGSCEGAWSERARRDAEREAALAAEILKQGVALGLDPGLVACISPFRAQVARLRRELLAAGLDRAEALTVDQSQGRDVEVVLVSLAAALGGGGGSSPGAGSEGAPRPPSSGALSVLEDRRRLNVALTRARSKLVVLGDPRRMRDTQALQCVWEELCKRGWVLPA